MASKQLQYFSVRFGCDPEFFFTNGKGEVVPSEEVIPDKLLCSADNIIIRDGVQGEMTVGTSTCRESMGYYISANFKFLKQYLETNRPDITVSVLGEGVVPEAAFKKLSEASRRFGCAPSKNFYNSVANVGIDGSSYRRRHAGGHIHLGGLIPEIYTTRLDYSTKSYVISTDLRDRLVPILDVVVGIPCVLIDRDPAQVERRKFYGRAGEYRLPNHGLEYRTPSNFWLRHHSLQSMVMSMSRFGVSILSSAVYSALPHVGKSFFDAEKELLKDVDFDMVVQAINTNDRELALRVMNHIAAFGEKRVVDEASGFPFSPKRLKAFLAFADDVEKRGLKKIFPTNPLAHWTDQSFTHSGRGFESFLYKNYGG